jgi:hypothetical protein
MKKTNDGQIILKDVPNDVLKIQIALENRLGPSEFSDLIHIECGFKGCKAPIAEIVSSISAISVVVFILFSIFFIRRLTTYLVLIKIKLNKIKIAFRRRSKVLKFDKELDNEKNLTPIIINKPKRDEPTYYYEIELHRQS